METRTKILLGGALFAVVWLAASSRARAAGFIGGGFMQPLNQGDPAWKNTLVGNSTRTCGDVGCVVTSMAMAANSLRGTNWTPADLRPGYAAGLKATDYSGAGLVLESAAQKLGLKCFDRIVDSQRNQAGIDNMRALIEATLANAGVAVLRVDYDLSSPETNHTIVCYAHSPAGYECMDPAGGKPITLDERLFLQRTSTKQYSCNGVAPLFAI